MHKITAVKTLSGFRISIKFSDGIKGVVDLSDLAGKGVFARWDSRRYFNSVYIDENHTVSWPGGIDLCPDSLYAEVTGKDLQAQFNKKTHRLVYG